MVDNPLWNDDNFIIDTGRFHGGATVSGADIGPGLIYYPSDSNIRHRIAGAVAPFSAPPRTGGKLNVLWNAGSELEELIPERRPSEFIRVALKAPAIVTEAMPGQLLGPAYASLLQADWAEPFKKSVQDDLEIIGSFVESLRDGPRPATLDLINNAVTAKKDLDLKLTWWTAESRYRGLVSYTSILAAAAGTGMIKVTANALDTASNPVNGCTVHYVTINNRNNPLYYYQFLRLSTPSVDTMAVGNYEMWAEKGGSAGPKRSVIPITTASSTIDLIAP